MAKTNTIIPVFLGNIFEYYDFLLFAHIGYIITPTFIPPQYVEQSHLIALFIFSLPFIVRPAGGYIFGRIADKHSTSQALNRTLFHASIASLLIALLPSHESLGILSTIAFIILRSLQGFALGGEYTTAGSFLMDKSLTHKSLMSGLLGASGTVGSLAAFFLAFIYNTHFSDTNTWRLFFVLGALTTYGSYCYRKQHMPLLPPPSVTNSRVNTRTAIALTVCIGAITSVSCFLPMVYSHFYLTQILGWTSTKGLYATFISLISYIIFTPLAGYGADRVGLLRMTYVSTLMLIPLSVIGFHHIQQGDLKGQILMTLGASLVGAPIHTLMNQMFSLSQRSRRINVLFTSGASIGGLLPFLSGYMRTHYGIASTPLWVLNGLAVFYFFLLWKIKNNVCEQPEFKVTLKY